MPEELLKKVGIQWVPFGKERRLSGKVFEMLFVNAGITNNQKETIGEVTTGDYERIPTLTCVPSSLPPAGKNRRPNSM